MTDDPKAELAVLLILAGVLFVAFTCGIIWQLKVLGF